MPNCPKCHQPVKPDDLSCSHCQTTLKAFGHPGVTIHRAASGEWLCQTCAYHKDETCTFPQYPYAQDCTLYTAWQKTGLPKVKGSSNDDIQRWIKRNSTWLILLGLFIVCLAIATRR